MAYNAKIEYLSGGKNIIADMLSRLPDSEAPASDTENDADDGTLDISDKTFEINTLNSNEFSPRKYAKYTQQPEEFFSTDDLKIQNLDMAHEQSKDLTILQLIDNLKQGKDDKEMQKFLLIENILYFITKPDTEAQLRLYVPEHLRKLVIKQYHDCNGHIGIDRTHSAISQKYF